MTARLALFDEIFSPFQAKYMMSRQRFRMVASLSRLNKVRPTAIANPQAVHEAKHTVSTAGNEHTHAVPGHIAIVPEIDNHPFLRS